MFTMLVHFVYFPFKNARNATSRSVTRYPVLMLLGFDEVFQNLPVSSYFTLLILPLLVAYTRQKIFPGLHKLKVVQLLQSLRCEKVFWCMYHLQSTI